MGVQRAASYARTFNSITMLEAAGLVLRDQERVRSAPSSSIGWRSEIAAWAAGQIADRMARSGAHAMQLHIGRIVLEIGRAHVSTPVTNAHLVCRLLLEKKKPPYP